MATNPFRGDAVQETAEFRRVDELPREIVGQAEVDRLVRDLTALLRTDTGEQTLRAIQARALYVVGTLKGGFFPIRVGGGKTILTALVPYILGSMRPVLILPAKLRDKTYRDFADYRQHWLVPRNIRIFSYEELGREGAANKLKDFSPDLIMCDEVHRLKNPKAAVTRRVDRFMRENPEVPFVGLSGSIMKDGLKDFAKIVGWALKLSAPVPLKTSEIAEWSEALDEKLSPDVKRRDPGVLLKWATKEDFAEVDGDDARAARRGFRRRFTETPGIVASANELLDCKMRIRAIEFDVDDVTEENFQKLRSTWMTPDDWALSLAPEVWRVANELALGLHYVWDPRPPDEWRLARKTWAAFARSVLSESRTLDSELQVKTAIRSGDIPEGVEILLAWEKVEKSFVPNPRPVWHDDTALDLCVKWMKESPGIVWTQHSFFARELAKRTGAAYFGAQGKDRHDRPIDDPKKVNPTTDPKGIIASVPANGEGRNLQVWNRNLITSPQGSPVLWEQLLGRTHRDGQKATEVTVDVFIACMEHSNAWQSALRGAQATADTTGLKQKLLEADVIGFPDEYELEERKEWRWGKQAAPESVHDILAAFSQQ